MEDQFPTPSEASGSETELTSQRGSDAACEPGAQAIEALLRAIAQEFVVAFDDFHEALLADDDSDLPPRAQSAGS